MDNNNYFTNGSGGEYESPHKDEYDRMVEQIKAKRKAMSTSIWTDQPLLKPYKSIWIDDDEPEETQEQAQPEESVQETVREEEPAAAEDSYYSAYTANPVIKDSRSEKLAFENSPKNYDDVIMPFINDYSVERKLPDQRRNLSRKPKANAAVELDYQRRRQAAVSSAPKKTDAAPIQHTIRSERFFDDEGEPLYRHVPQKSERSKPVMVPLSQRAETLESEKKKKSASGGAGTTFRHKSYSGDMPPMPAAASAGEQAAPEKPKPLAVARAERSMQAFNALICVGAIFIIAIVLLIMTIMGKRETKSESEKRDLAKFPKLSISSLFNGKFTSGISTYFTDTIPGRENFKSFSASFTDCFGFNAGGVKLSTTLKKVKQEKYEGSENDSKVEVNTDPAAVIIDPGKSNTNKDEVVKIPENTNEGKMLGDIIVYGSGKDTRGLSVSYVNFEMGKRYAEVINKWKEDIGEGVNVYSMPCPLSSAFYMPENMKGHSSDQNENIKNINGNLKGVVGINCFNNLAKHVNEDIYARTDHHWLPLGAYYGTQVFAEAAQVDYPSLSEYDKLVKEGFVGTFYTYSNYDQGIKNNPDTFTYFKPKNINDVTSTYYTTDFASTFEPIGADSSGIFYDDMSGENCYLSLLGSDAEIVEINTSCKNNRVLVMFKNSFGNAMVPFLTNSFSKIYVCDYRYFTINGVDFCRRVGCTDLLFTGAISLICSDVGIDTLSNIRVQ